MTVPRFVSTFLFESKTFDEDFHRLNDAIAEGARAIDGYLGEEEWRDAESGLATEVYYWATREAMMELVSMAQHRQAKSEHDRWIGRYRVVIAEVSATYGDPSLGMRHVPPSRSAGDPGAETS